MNLVPQLYSDGVQDDTAAIQALLDSGISYVHLPQQDHYMISRPLMFGSNQKLRFDRFTRILGRDHVKLPYRQTFDLRRQTGQPSEKAAILQFNRKTITIPQNKREPLWAIYWRCIETGHPPE